MARKRPVPSTKPAITCSPAWAWFFAGILVGIVISFIFYLQEIAPNHLPVVAENTVTTVQTNSQNVEQPETLAASEKVKNTKQFEFYDVLPNGGAKKTTSAVVEAPVEDLETIDLSPVQIPGTYLLQIGSFRDAHGAEALQTYLATLNVRTYIQQAEMKEANGAVALWHRVMAGPFTNLALLNQTRNTLAIQNIQTIAVPIGNN